MNVLLLKAYQAAARTPSDINEHVSKLRLMAEQCRHVTEFGVRYGVSTIALLAGSIDGKLRLLVSYDVAKTAEVDRIMGISGGLWTFINGSSTSRPIDTTDMLFIDTLHTREQLTLELLLHHRRVKRWIVMHDTVLFGERGEGSPEGLLPAIRDFLRENQQWFVSQHFENNNGLTVLSKNKNDYYAGIQL